MKPTFSIICFTVLSGAGLGLAALTAIFASVISTPSLRIGIAIAFIITNAGLIASVFHLTNPKNAWRAIMRVRTSWLSREAVCALIFMPLLLLFVFYDSVLILRAAVVVMATLTVICTAMIYQSLKPIAAWHHPQTTIGYLLFATQSGGTILMAIAAADDNKPLLLAAIIILSTLAAVINKRFYFTRIGGEEIHIGNAIGQTQAAARLLEAGHTSPTFLTREFIHHISVQRLRLLRLIMLGLVSIPPLAAVMASGVIINTLCVLLLLGGLIIERWLFFAEARHTVRAYHGIGKP